MTKYRFLRFSKPNKAILEKDSELFLASYADTSVGGEVMVFRCNAYGDVADWTDVDGGRGYKSLEEFLDNFSTPATVVKL